MRKCEAVFQLDIVIHNYPFHLSIVQKKKRKKDITQQTNFSSTDLWQEFVLEDITCWFSPRIEL